MGNPDAHWKHWHFKINLHAKTQDHTLFHNFNLNDLNISRTTVELELTALGQPCGTSHSCRWQCVHRTNAAICCDFPPSPKKCTLSSRRSALRRMKDESRSRHISHLREFCRQMLRFAV